VVAGPGTTLRKDFPDPHDQGLMNRSDNRSVFLPIWKHEESKILIERPTSGDERYETIPLLDRMGENGLL
jgi:hypothetical protein